MNREERQAALDNISPEDLAKIQARTSKAVTIDAEDLLEAEFALKFGWEAYRDYKDDKLTPKEFMTLIAASRKLDSLSQYKQAQAMFVASASAQSKKPAQTFKSLTANLLKNAEADV